MFWHTYGLTPVYALAIFVSLHDGHFGRSKIDLLNFVWFKKAIKDQNPYNNFYFNTHKCIVNIAQSILNQKMKKNLANFVITLQTVNTK